MKILFIGDIVGSPARKAIKELLPGIIKEHNISFVVANGENAAGGSGITLRVAEELLGMGISVLTSGDHIWKKREIFDFIDNEERILRPYNLASGVPGRGCGIYKTSDGFKVGVINVQGRVFMPPIDCPFKSAIAAIEDLLKETKVIIVDMHAEATSEKIALGWYLDGKASAVFGTHTHVQTADERILPQGTAYITDVGMAGSFDSVIGRRVEDVLMRFVTGVPVRFEVADSNVVLQAVIVEIDETSGKANSIFRIQERLKDA